MTELEKALYADVAWLKGVLEGRRSPSLGGHGHSDKVLMDAARELKGTLDKYLEAERVKDFTAEDLEAERNGGRR